MIDPSLGYHALIESIRSAHPMFDVSDEGVRLRQVLDGLYQSLPMQCLGKSCPIASRCPLSSREDIVGTRCVLEISEVTVRLARYLSDLGLDSAPYTDIQTAAHLARIDVLIWRIEQLLAVQGMTVPETVVVRGQSVEREVPHPLLAELRGLLKEQRALKEELVATRRARLERQSKEGKAERDLLRMLMQMQKSLNAKELTDPVLAIPESLDPSELDAIVVEDAQQEDQS